MNRKAQALIEYSVLIACITAALIGMQFYLKRSIQGRVKQSSDQIGDPYDAASINSHVTSSTEVDMTSTSTIVELPELARDEQKAYGFDTSTTQSAKISRTFDESMGGSR